MPGRATDATRSALSLLAAFVTAASLCNRTLRDLRRQAPSLPRTRSTGISVPRRPSSLPRARLHQGRHRRRLAPDVPGGRRPPRHGLGRLHSLASTRVLLVLMSAQLTAAFSVDGRHCVELASNNGRTLT
ncbi:Hypothetical protein MexAM1_META1p3778 [Methylorubrum extorquens AM1]|uniref:Uncharacterized protein n=1 Tax=Methylorubrum extorquens (strain ATCC 14718 / DSM 1338 / JCM 2805 / NCIMB 9133 / AM1) TaxID=272630 RepID=C5AZV1_METEA|nr:Hypothetical protein MexAM1_META1p3778 [Methylorubrum extorquens AM1]